MRRLRGGAMARKLIAAVEVVLFVALAYLLFSWLARLIAGVIA